MDVGAMARRARAALVVAAALVLAAAATTSLGARAPSKLARSLSPMQQGEGVQVDFDYFVYTLTWPFTFCEGKSCVKDVP